MHFNFTERMPKSLRNSPVFIAVSVVFTIVEEIEEFHPTAAILVVCILIEVRCLQFWDILETEDHIQLYKTCIDVFQNFPDATYYVAYKEPRTDITKSDNDELTDLYSKCNPFFLVAPIAMAVMMNLIFMCVVIANTYECLCSPLNITCFCLILVPRAINLIASALFLIWHEKNYMRKHWDE